MTNNLLMCVIAASLLQALDKHQESLLHFREAVKLAPNNFEAQKGRHFVRVYLVFVEALSSLSWNVLLS